MWVEDQQIIERNFVAEVFEWNEIWIRGEYYKCITKTKFWNCETNRKAQETKEWERWNKIAARMSVWINVSTKGSCMLQVW